MELDNFKDYLLQHPRHGLGFKSLTQVELLMKSNEYNGPTVMDLLRKEIPNWDELVLKESRRAMTRQSPAAAHGEIGKGRIRPDNVRSNDYGNDQTYTVRRLMRDAPELVELVRTGELSPHAAAIKAGFRRPTLSISDNPESAAASIRKKFGPDFAQALKAAL
jgi:hypothetical protein